MDSNTYAVVFTEFDGVSDYPIRVVAPLLYKEAEQLVNKYTNDLCYIVLCTDKLSKE